MAALVRETALREAEYAFDGLRERLAWSLVELASGADRPAGDAIRLGVAQEELARMARGTRENVNRALQAMVDDRLIDVGRGYVVVLEVEELRAMAEMGSQRITRKDERVGL
jgi:CRP-like cAMP-binding protein